MFRYARIKVSPSGEIFTQFVDLTQEDVLNRASGEFVPSMMSGKSVSDLFMMLIVRWNGTNPLERRDVVSWVYAPVKTV